MELSPHQVDLARVLVVDDDRDTAETMACLLRAYGHEALVAFDGPRAIEAARRHRPGYVLLDIGLPGMDGYQLASRLRAESPGPMVLIAITGYGREEERRLGRSAGFDHYFLKPLDPVGLNTLLTALAARPGDRGSAPTDGRARAAQGPAGADPSLGDGDGRVKVASVFGRPPASDGESSTAPTGPQKGPILAIRRSFELTNALGLHLRAAERFVRVVRQFNAEVRVSCDGRRVSGRSLLDLMTLGAPCGTRLEVEAEGRDAEATLEALTALIDRGFDE